MELLKRKIIAQIKFYQKYDNPEPEGFFSLFRLFSPQGKKGRIRAKEYLKEANAITESEALLKFYRDFSNVTDGLGNSTLLRRRIGEGLCDYFNLSAMLEERIEKQYQATCKASIIYGGPIPERSFLKDTLMAKVLRRKMDEFFQPQEINNLQNIPMNTLK